MRRYHNHWKDSKNWRFNSIYICQDDTRIVVPKKRAWAGWTFNFAHKWSYILLIYVLFVAFAPSLYVIAAGKLHNLGYALGISTVLAVVAVLLCSRRGREKQGRG